MTKRSAPALNRRLRSLYSWHRWLGIAAAFFVLLFACTGLALNHSASLGLDHCYLQHPFWQTLYKLDPNIEVRGQEQSGHWFSEAQGRLYFDTRFITEGSAPHTVLQIDEGWVLASPSALLLIDAKGALLERITAEQLPGRILSVSLLHDGLLLHTPYADFTGNLDSLAWQPIPATRPIIARQSTSQPAELVSAIQADIRSQTLHAERLLLDLHSGRLFGLAGVMIMDSAAIALIALGLSGLLLWLRYRRKQGQRKRRSKHKTRQSAD